MRVLHNDVYKNITYEKKAYLYCGNLNASPAASPKLERLSFSFIRVFFSCFRRIQSFGIIARHGEHDDEKRRNALRDT